MSPMERRADYGYDAPYALMMFAALGAASVVAAIVSWWNQRGPRAGLTFYGAFSLANAFSFLYTTRRGKFQVWDEILDELHLGGDQRVLDMGCGRGAVLIAVARRLTTGRVNARPIREFQPGGRVAIADLRATARYARRLSELGAIGIERRRLGWRFWYGNPFAGTSLVTASKR
jgi:hypothetical protein